ncbi:hypothetical protein HZB88_04045 [archaeon]|nr:hypothetical protein [archaeon]
MVWYIATFFVLLLPLLIVLGIVYAAMKKLYPLMWILAVFTYINTVTYSIGAYNLGENGILALLSFSAILMIGFGMYIAYLRKKGKEK